MQRGRSHYDSRSELSRASTPMTRSLRILSYPAFERAASNPYTALLCLELMALGHHVSDFSGRRVRKEPWDVIHIHWPHFLVDRRSPLRLWQGARKALRGLDRAKERGAKLFWTAHNVVSHEVDHPRAEKSFMEALLARLDGFIALSGAGLKEARAYWPALRSLPGFVIPHGHYREVYPRPFTRTEARRRLVIEEDATVICWIGQIRPYKNVPALIGTFRSIDDPRLILTVCGKPSGLRTEEAVTLAAGDDPRVRLKLKFVPDFEMAWHLIAADLVVLPYAKIQNSGSALLALSFDRPVVVPEQGAMPELRDAVGPQWVQTYRGDFDARVLREAVAWERAGARAAVPLEAFEWRGIAKSTADAYSAVLR